MLTLVRKTMKAKSTKVALQPPQGKRLTSELPMNISLLGVLAHFEPQLNANIISQPDQPYSYPIITFMNRRFTSVDELRTTTLLSLGAVNSLLRLTFGTPSGQTPQDLGLDASEFVIEPKEEEPEKKKPKRDPTAPKSSAKQDDSTKSPPATLSTPERQIQFVQVSQNKTASATNAHVPDEVFELRASDLKDTTPNLSKLAPFERPKFLEEQKKRFRVVSKFLSTTRWYCINLEAQVKIRIVFPTQDYLQAQFAVTETVNDLVTFVQSCLNDPQIPFELFVIPPKRVLPLRSTLFDEQLYPAAKVYLSWKQEAPQGSLLRSDLELATPVEPTPVDTNTLMEETQPTQASSSNVDKAPKSRSSVPKWFSMGKK